MASQSFGSLTFASGQISGNFEEIFENCSKYAKTIESKVNSCHMVVNSSKQMGTDAKSLRSQLYSLANLINKQMQAASTVITKLSNIAASEIDRINEHEKIRNEFYTKVADVFSKLQLKAIDKSVPVNLPQSNEYHGTLFQFVEINSVKTINDQIGFLLQTIEKEAKEFQLKVGFQKLKYRNINKKIEKLKNLEGIENFFIRGVSDSSLSANIDSTLLAQSQYFGLLSSKVVSFFTVYDNIAHTIQKGEEVSEIEKMKVMGIFTDSYLKNFVLNLDQNITQISAFHNSISTVYTNYLNLYKSFNLIQKRCTKLHQSLEYLFYTLIPHSKSHQDGSSELVKCFEELENLVNWYEMFIQSYDMLKQEMKRRKEESKRQEKLIQNIQKELELLFYNECYQRESFFQNFGIYLPSTFCPKITELPPLYQLIEQQPQPPEQPKNENNNNQPGE